MRGRDYGPLGPRLTALSGIVLAILLLVVVSAVVVVLVAVLTR